MKKYIELLRPRQWVKNLIIYAPLFFTFNFTLEKIIPVSAGFFIFCLASSSVYIFNDYYDIDEDRAHPVKRDRPLAAGLIGEKAAVILLIFIMAAVLVSSRIISLHFFAIIIIYFAVNAAYTVKLKDIPILDVTLIASGFILRILAGSALIHVETSMWIVLVTFMLAMFLALAKRRDDCLIAGEGSRTRKNIDGYNIELINISMALMAGVTIVAYIMYTVTPEVMERMGSENLYLTVVFVIAGILRYMQITFVERNSGDPTGVLLRDRFLQITMTAWLLSFYFFYLFK